MVKIKICGITNLDDARLAVEAGADLLGFNFYRPSPRFIEPDEARKIIDGVVRESEVIAVGIFVDETLESVIETVRVSGVDAVQLHGDESVAYCADLKSALNGITIIKALRVSDSFQPQTATGYPVDAIMLDAFHDSLRGGTGKTIDWEIAENTRNLVPQFFLSGGLSPENVAEAVERVQPYAVDACSRLELSPGRKDSLRVKAFVRAARNG
ncbi:MAG TPA: phosphoribosylanthranilate isomerase [Pyrinomonadaceae bacterium]|jgi:phosphoribosylanthranilate isomerase